MEPAARAASIITGALAFKDLVVSEKLEPDMAKNTPLCSQQYRYMFNSTRIPKLPSDETRVVDASQNQHIIVVRKNKFFSLDLELI